MINIEQAVVNKFPTFRNRSGLIRRPTLSLLRKLTHEREINDFLSAHGDKSALDFIDSVFDYFNFSYTVRSQEHRNIPALGRVVIIANHPIGSLDGLALLRMISDLRPDVRIIANDLLTYFEPLKPLLIAVDNMGSSSALKTYRAALSHLNNEGAVIIFPAGEVSRARPSGVRDRRWRPGFLQLARRAQAPVLPINIQAKNSLLFYSASLLFKPLGTALLASEMFNKKSANLDFRIGEPIAVESLCSDKLNDKSLILRLKKHLYNIGRPQASHFVTEKTIAHPEERGQLAKDFKHLTRLGGTRDDNGIYLVNYNESPSLMREIGRLRELSFRKVGEGTGAKRDLDPYDHNYQHLVLWDRDALAVAGSYRIGEAAKLLSQHGEQGLYTHSLFTFKPSLRPYLEQSLELGRSFVNPSYWGKNSLDYLWQGVGAYLRHNPQVRYMIGPVSISANYPKDLTDHLVFFYQRFYACAEELASARHPYIIQPERLQLLSNEYIELDRESGFKHLQAVFQAKQQKIPILLKQYASLFADGGFQLLSFSRDPDFSNCLDGLFLADLNKLKAAKRKRYLEL
jgi:putative hemolysin